MSHPEQRSENDYFRTASGDDQHLFRFANSGSVAGAELTCNGSSALLSRTPDGVFSRFALCEGTSLTFGGRVLFQSSSPGVAAFSNWAEYDVRDRVRIPRTEPERLFGSISLPENARVQVWCPRNPLESRPGGKPADPVGFGEKTNLCAFELSKGTHEIEMRLSK